MTMIEVSPADFERMNKGLIHLLKAVQSSGKEGISTRKLYAKIRMVGYGDKLVDRAEREGYIKRVKKPPIKQGAWLVVNRLTPKGQDLLRRLDVT